jgi:glycosyltransferase involved in cell wall biosynthesis
LRILMLTRFYLNGQTTHVFSLCSELLKAGHQPFLAAVNLDHPAYRQWLSSRRIPFTTSAEQHHLDKLMENYSFDLIHTHSAHTLELALDFGRRYQIPAAATCHYLDFEPLDLLAAADKIITISPEMAETLALPAEKTVMIENGVDIRALRTEQIPRNHSVPTALIAVRMTEEKEPGCAELVRALTAQGWKVYSVGNWRPYYLGIPYSGWQVNLTALYQAADLVIGTGRSVREGMAAGAACFVLGDYLDGVVTEANVELLRHYNFSGRAAKQLPDPQVIAAQVEYLSKTNLAELQEFSASYAQEHFSLQEMTDAVISVYRSLVG